MDEIEQLTKEDYMVAVALSEDTIMLGEVIVVHRYGEKERIYSINAQNNMAGTVRDAFQPAPEMTQRENQRRILHDYAASTNKGHVKVGFSVGVESWRAFRDLRRSSRARKETPDLLSIEEMDLIKMVFKYKKEDAAARD